MKKRYKIGGVCLCAAATVLLSGCGNRAIIDTTYNFDKAIVKMPDGTVQTMDIVQWKDYEDGEQIQITASDGKTYLLSSYNCVLVDNRGQEDE